MPDHLHGIVWVVDPFSGAAPSSSRGPAARSLGAFVAQFKSRVTKAAVAAGLWQPGARLWQRGYHERIIASVEGLRRARRYIRLNPERAADS
jgi:REP element-mobilizing transposase RayT